MNPAGTVVYNFIGEQAAIVQALVDRGSIEVLEWFSYPPYGTVNIKEFADVRYNTVDSFGRGEEIYEDLLGVLPTFLDMHQRRFPYFQNTLYDSLGDFNMQFGAVVKLLVDTAPDLVLFGNIPHGGHDLLLFEIAKAMGIRTLILYQIPIRPRFLVVEQPEQISCERLRHEPTEPVDEPFPRIEAPIYMRKRRLSLRTTLIESRRYLRYLTSISAAVQLSREWQYAARLRKATQPLPAEGRFVYFPLHLQPEMTTSALGGGYGDQMLAIERLSRKIPQDVVILIKENPKQRAYQRPKSFFGRLAAMSNVAMVQSSADTYELIDKSVAVATITGTAGWEAINMNTPAIVFGRTWYETLPGVIKYDSGFSFDQVCQTDINHDHLIDRYRRLMRRAWPGVVQSAYAGLQPEVSPQENTRLVVSALEQVLARPRT